MKGLFSKKLYKYIGDFIDDKNEVDNYIIIDEYFSYIMILNIDIFRALMIFEVFRESKASLIVI